MSQTIAVLTPAAVDHESTLILAIEMSNKSWVLAAQVPGLPRKKAKRTVDPDAEACWRPSPDIATALPLPAAASSA